MGRINPDEMDNYSSSNGSEWLSLKDDGDVERVQFLYDKYEDLDTFAVHKVRLEGNNYDRMVNCIRDYDDPIDCCPLCAAGYKVEPAMILSMYSHNEMMNKNTDQLKEVKLLEKLWNLSLTATRYCPIWYLKLSATEKLETKKQPMNL